MSLDGGIGVFYAFSAMMKRKIRMGPLTLRSAWLHVGLMRQGVG
jgi:hypothetical protein